MYFLRSLDVGANSKVYQLNFSASGQDNEGLVPYQFVSNLRRSHGFGRRSEFVRLRFRDPHGYGGSAIAACAHQDSADEVFGQATGEPRYRWETVSLYYRVEAAHGAAKI